MEGAFSSETVDDRGPLDSERVAFTGRLASMTRLEAAELVRTAGGEFSPSVTRKTTVLVIGEEGWPLKKDGRLTRNLLRAQQQGIDVASEGEFLERLGLQDLGESICRRYTLTQLSRMLGVRRDRLRSWMQAGLVQPVESQPPVHYFDFRQVARVKTLYELSQAGVSNSLLRNSLRQLRSWMPDADEALDRLMLIDGGRLAVDSSGGHLSEINGQLLIDFDEDVVEHPRYEKPLTPDGLFAAAVDWEDAERFDDAATAYRRWLAEFGPDSEVCFNLANVLSELGQTAAAIERYRQAVELDPGHAPAWHNLATVLADVGWHDEALVACERALEVLPAYADVHYTMADVLDQMGRLVEARRHWRAYLEHDSASEYAEYARRRLESSA